MDMKRALFFIPLQLLQPLQRLLPPLARMNHEEPVGAVPFRSGRICAAGETTRFTLHFRKYPAFGVLASKFLP